MMNSIPPKFKEFIERPCPRCKGSGAEEVFGYMMYDNFGQPIPRMITCRVCKGNGKIKYKKIKR